jgi:hypothetical protein
LVSIVGMQAPACAGLIGLDGLTDRIEGATDAAGPSEASACDARAAGWLSGWAYRARIPIVNRADAAIDDYQVQLTFDTAARTQWKKLATDGSDLRITASDGATVLPHWTEKDSLDRPATILWTRVPSIPKTGGAVYVYYGNPSARNASNLETTFVSGVIQNPTFATASGWALRGPDRGGTGSIEIPGGCPGGCARMKLVRGPDPNGSYLFAYQGVRFPDAPPGTAYRIVFDMTVSYCDHCLPGLWRDDAFLFNAFAPGSYRDLVTNPIAPGSAFALSIVAGVEGTTSDAQSVDVTFANLRVRRDVVPAPESLGEEAEESACP